MRDQIFKSVSDYKNGSALVVYSAITFRKKVLAIPPVAASETGTAQTIHIYMYGVVGQQR